MPQHIGIQIIKKNNNIENSTLNFADVINKIPNIKDSEYKNIAKISSYDDTLFGFDDIQLLIFDLKKIEQLYHLSSDFRLLFVNLKPNETVRFIGD